LAHQSCANEENSNEGIKEVTDELKDEVSRDLKREVAVKITRLSKR
jgi:hypothetical protein